MRPLLSDCAVYHHAPVSFRDGVNFGPWLAMEFVSPVGTKGWATIVRLGAADVSDGYLFKPRGLDVGKTYKVTFDNTGGTATIDSWSLINNGVNIRLESPLSSELLLYEAR
jgi:alpha-galactosidase